MLVVTIHLARVSSYYIYFTPNVKSEKKTHHESYISGLLSKATFYDSYILLDFFALHETGRQNLTIICTNFFS